MKQLFALVLTLVLALITGEASAQARNCILPGDTVEVRTPGFLKNQEPNLFVRPEKNGSPVPVTVLSFNSSRLTFRVPRVELPWNKPIKFFHVDSRSREKLVANLKACADPNGEGGGGSDAAGIGNGPGSGRMLANPIARPLARATGDDVVAPSGAPEYVLVGSTNSITEAELILAEQGVTILKRVPLQGLGITLITVDLNGGVSLSQLRALFAQQRIRVTIDRHNVYGASAGAKVYANALVGLPPTSGCRLRNPVRIGLIDGPVDRDHPALAGVSILTTSVLNARERIGSPDHATGIAALMTSQGTSSLPQGIAPGAQIFSVVAFARAGGRDVARLENIAEALDWMIKRKVRLVNMSLAGPYNVTLASIIEIADSRGLVMVAATGNGGRQRVDYPASDPRVIAVTAVDAAKRQYRRANSGPSVDFAAPGVDLLVPRRSGTAYRSGTSYAAAVVSALVAQEISKGASGRDRLVSRLRARVEDLGVPGRDPNYGWGLVKAGPCQ